MSKVVKKTYNPLRDKVVGLPKSVIQPFPGTYYGIIKEVSMNTERAKINIKVTLCIDDIEFDMEKGYENSSNAVVYRTPFWYFLNSFGAIRGNKILWEEIFQREVVIEIKEGERYEGVYIYSITPYTDDSEQEEYEEESDDYESEYEARDDYDEGDYE